MSAVIVITDVAQDAEIRASIETTQRTSLGMHLVKTGLDHPQRRPTPEEDPNPDRFALPRSLKCRAQRYTQHIRSILCAHTPKK